MRSKLTLLSVFFLTLLFGFFFTAKSALADSFTLIGNVQDSSGVAIGNATVNVTDATTGTSIGSTTSDPSSGSYALSVPNGMYNVQVTPSAGSNFSSAIAYSQNISQNTTLNFILTPAGTVTFSGHVKDRQGTVLPGQFVQLVDASSNRHTLQTDATGYYSLQVTAGTYTLNISSPTGNNLSINAPVSYQITKNNYSLTMSKLVEILLPVKKVTIHAQTSSGTAFGNVAIKAIKTNGGSLSNASGLSLGGDITNADGTSTYPYSLNSGQPVPQTDTFTGSVNLWLLPNNQNLSYTFSAIPPSGSGFQTTISSATAITDDITLPIILQQSVTLDGHIKDTLGTPIPNQFVQLVDASSNRFTSTTDSTGHYSIQVSPGTYTLNISSPTSNSLSLNAPASYQITKNNYSVNTNKTEEIVLPLKKVTMHVQDSAGAPIGNVLIKAITTNGSLANSGALFLGGDITNADGTSTYPYNLNSGFAVPKTDATTGNVDLWLLPNNGSFSYTFSAVPPSGSSYQTTTSTNAITNDITLPLTLVQPVTFSGHVNDSQGIGYPLSGQFVDLVDSSSNHHTTQTDSTGFYSLQVTSGTYTLNISSPTANSLSVNAPVSYQLIKNNYSINTNKSEEIVLPVKKVTIHIQDSFNKPVSNISIRAVNASGTLSNATGLSAGGDITSADGTSTYPYQPNSGQPVPSTDQSGNMVLLLFPNNGNLSYNFSAIPPSGSIYSTFSLTNKAILDDQTELISLQYNHATPITNVSLSPVPDTQGDYSDPTTVTLSATAASGYTVPNGNTYYTIDGVIPQTYSTPFTVSGNGSHTITYWSIDNSGVQETHNSKTFTILTTYSLSGTVYNDANQNGFQDAGEAGYSGATVSLDNGQTTTTDTNGNYSFTGLPAATYTETLTLPNGYTATTTNPASISLSADTTENFGIAQASSLVLAINAGGDTQGNFVSDTDATGGSTYSSSNAVDTSNVTNPAPQAVYQTVRYGNFSYVIPNLTANSAYTVRLHFNELYWGTLLSGNSGGDGSRVFNVSVNGTQVLSNYDIYHNAGGANKAIVEQIPATADADGKITLQFTTVTDNAMVNGIELYSGTLPTPTPTATPTPVTSLKIDAGGSTAGSFVADKDYSGGQPYTSTASVDTTGVTNPAPESVYQSVRYGNMTYTIPNLVPNSSYTVRLHFNELYWGTALAGNTGGAGSRVFNVSINSNQVLTDFDIYQQAGGANKALVKDFTATSDANGKITINFSTVTDNAMINGIELFQ